MLHQLQNQSETVKLCLLNQPTNQPSIKQIYLVHSVCLSITLTLSFFFSFSLSLCQYIYLLSICSWFIRKSLFRTLSSILVTFMKTIAPKFANSHIIQNSKCRSLKLGTFEQKNQHKWLLFSFSQCLQPKRIL